MKKQQQFPVQKAIYMTERMSRDIKKAAKAEQMTFTQFVRESIKAALERRESKEAK